MPNLRLSGSALLYGVAVVSAGIGFALLATGFADPPPRETVSRSEESALQPDTAGAVPTAAGRVHPGESPPGSASAGEVPIVYDHGQERTAVPMRARWGAALITFAAVLVVAARLTEVWKRHRDEIVGS